MGRRIIEFDKALKIYPNFLMQNIARIWRLESKKMYPFYTKKQRKMLKKAQLMKITRYETYPYQKWQIEIKKTSGKQLFELVEFIELLFSSSFR
jgi:hypothetical protein